MVKNTDDLYQLFSEEEIIERRNQIRKKQSETAQAHFIKKAQEVADKLALENSGAARVILTENPREPIVISIPEPEIIEEEEEGTIEELVEEITNDIIEEEASSEPEPPRERTKADTIKEVEALLKQLKGE